MVAVLVVLRAGLMALAAAFVLGAVLLLALWRLRLIPPGDAGWALVDLVLLGAVLLVLVRGTRWVPAAPPGALFRPAAGSDVAAALRIGLAYTGIKWIASPLLGDGLPEFERLPGTFEVLGTIASATMEEALFRGYLLWALLRIGRPWAAVLAPSAVFAALHLPNLAVCGELFEPVALVAFLGWGVSGLAYAAMTVLSGRIWPAIAFHALHNLLVTAAGGGGCG